MAGREICRRRSRIRSLSLSLSLSLSVWENGVWGIGVIDTLLQFRPRAQFRPRIVRMRVSLKELLHKKFYLKSSEHLLYVKGSFSKSSYRLKGTHNDTNQRYIR